MNSILILFSYNFNVFAPLNLSKTIHVSKEANDGDNQAKAEAKQSTETIKQSSLKSIHDVLQH